MVFWCEAHAGIRGLTLRVSVSWSCQINRGADCGV